MKRLILCPLYENYRYFENKIIQKQSFAIKNFKLANNTSLKLKKKVIDL